MNLSNLSDDIHIKYREKEPELACSYTYSRPHFKVNEDDFFLDVKNVARYRVQNGQTIWVNPYESADSVTDLPAF